MTQNDLNRAVARATGETVTAIRHLGFQPLEPEPSGPEDLTVDWDTVQTERQVAVRAERVALVPCPV